MGKQNLIEITNEQNSHLSHVWIERMFIRVNHHNFFHIGVLDIVWSACKVSKHFKKNLHHKFTPKMIQIVILNFKTSLVHNLHPGSRTELHNPIEGLQPTRAELDSTTVLKYRGPKVSIPPPCFIFEGCCFADGILYLLVRGFHH